MTTRLANDLEIPEVIDEDADISEGSFNELDEEEKTPVEESVSTLISDLDQMDSSEWFDLHS
jgi:hypothetical protein